MPTVEQITADPEFAKFGPDAQDRILRSLVGDEAANNYRSQTAIKDPEALKSLLVQKQKTQELDAHQQAAIQADADAGSVHKAIGKSVLEGIGKVAGAPKQGVDTLVNALLGSIEGDPLKHFSMTDAQAHGVENTVQQPSIGQNIVEALGKSGPTTASFMAPGTTSSSFAKGYVSEPTTVAGGAGKSLLRNLADIITDPVALTGVGGGSKAVSAAFAALMAHGTMEGYNALKESYAKQGLDPHTAETATDTLVSALMTTMSAAHLAPSVHPKLPPLIGADQPPGLNRGPFVVPETQRLASPALETARVQPSAALPSSPVLEAARAAPAAPGPITDLPSFTAALAAHKAAVTPPAPLIDFPDLLAHGKLPPSDELAAALAEANAAIPDEPVTGVKPVPLTENASGESAASAEALSRQASMAAQKRQFVVYDRSGNEKPLIGPDAVDYVAQPGETYGIKGPEGFRPLDDRGGKPPSVALPPSGAAAEISAAPIPSSAAPAAEAASTPSLEEISARAKAESKAPPEITARTGGQTVHVGDILPDGRVVLDIDPASGIPTLSKRRAGGAASPPIPKVLLSPPGI